MAEENKNGKKILIIDDDNFLLDMYALKFGQNGYQVDTALGSTVALDKLKAGATPDVIVTDLLMPVMDGFELLEKIRDEKLVPNAKRIILSNLSQDGDIERGNSLEVDGYIVKASCTPSEVLEKVNKIIEQK
ncbi:MAG: response regulator [Candidatus Pacebacteria bacterium]|jgi:CheY-like chemotaxis protein|nr:response regulator [Candidatus Paceibacterota bacterium]MBP9058189.1 response regulator [Candidatus Paceibacterota bacterium]MBP9769893.1 response regulator [Candidatus Paceibacterota bacterium]